MDRLWNWFRRLPRWLGAGLLATGLFTIGWAYLLPPTYRASLTPADMVERDAHLYSAVIAAPAGATAFLFQLDRDLPSAPEASRLRLHEDNRPLGPAHSPRDDIKNLGSGRFQHSDGRLAFSASDNSDPRANGRSYAVEARLTPRIRLLAAAFALILLGSARFAASAAPALRAAVRLSGPLGAATYVAAAIASFILFWTAIPNPLLWLAGVGLLLLGAASGFTAAGFTREAISDRLFIPRDAEHTGKWSLPVSPVLAWALAGAAAGLALYTLMLLQGASPSLGLASYFQVSDASGYWSCANQIIDDGATNSWCHRRPLYPVFLSGVSLLGGRDLLLVLLLQAGMTGICTFLFAREIARWLGPLAAAFAVVTIGLYARTFVFGQTMTEVLGLSFGLIAGSLLLRAGEQRSFPLVLCGVFLFALGQLERPGALFALPFLIIWAGMMRGRKPARFLVGFGLSAAAAVLALGLNFAAIIAVGGDPAATNANFPQTLYGLSVGRDWSSLLADHPELGSETPEAVRQAYALAFGNIAASPGVFLRTLGSNFLGYLDYPWYRDLVPISLLRISLVLGSVIAAALAARRSWRAALVLAVAAGEVISAPFLTGDANVRVWAVSAPLAQAGSAALLLVMLAHAAFRTDGPNAIVSNGAVPALPNRMLLSAAGVLLALCVIPLTPLRLAARTPEPASLPACGSGLRALAVDTSASAWMTISADGAPAAKSPMRIDRDRLIAHMSPDSWVTPSLRGLGDVQLINGIAVEAGVGLIVNLYAPADLAIPRSRPALLCVDDTQQIEIAAVPYKRIVSVADPPP